MANNKQIKITLDLDAQISSLEKKVSQAKATMQKAFGAGTTPELENAFKSIIKVLDTIKEKTKTPIVSQAGFNAVAAQIGKADVALEKLYDAFENLASLSEDRKIDLLPDDVRKNVRDTIQVFGEFEDVLKNAEVKTKDLIKAENELAKSKDKLETLAAKREGIKKLQDQAQAEEDSLKASLDKIKALEEEQEELEKLNKLYEKQGVNKTKKLTDKKGNVVASLPAQRQKVNRAKLAVDTDPVAAANVGKSAAELSAMLREASSKVTPYSSEIRKLDSDINILGVTIEGLEAKLKELNSAFESKKTEDVNSAFLDLRAAANKAGIAIDDIPVEYTEEGFKELQSRLATFKAQAVEPLNKSIKNMDETMQQATGSVHEMGERTEESSETFKQQNEILQDQTALENKIKGFIGWAGASELLRRSLSNAFSAVKELDAVMTEMSVVTDLTVGDYWDQLPEYTARANDLGVSIRSAYESATLYYQQGLKTNEVTAVSAETLKLMKIAGISAEDATNKMTAALRGFNMEINEMNAQKVSDVYAELAAITAADVDEISNAMTKTASIASSANMEFETTAAFLSQIIETTRESSETAGTAMKTIIARFQELKKAPEEIGEVDGEIVDANAIETALRAVGVALRDTNGQFRDLDDVFLELSSKWSGLDTNTQRYIATIAAGSRQQSRFIAMMSDYGRTQELVAAATNSAGASQKQYEKTLNSLESKLARLDNAWTTFSTGIMNSELVKAGVDILTALVTALNNVSKGFNSWTGSIAKIGLIVTLFNTAQKLFESLLKAIPEKFYEQGKEAAKRFEKGFKDEKKETEQRTTQEPPSPKGDKKKGGFSGVFQGARGVLSSKKLLGELDTSIEENNTKKIEVQAEIDKNKALVETLNELSEKANKAEIALKSTTKAVATLTEKKSNLVEGTEEYIKVAKDLEAKIKAQKTQQEKLTNATEEYTDTLKGNEKVLDDYADNLEKINELNKEGARLESDRADVVEEQDSSFEQLADSLQQIGEILVVVGVGAAAFGSTLEDWGLSGAEKALGDIGGALTGVGTVLAAGIPMVLTLKTAFDQAGISAFVSGIAAEIGWAPVILTIAAIVAGIMILIAAIVLIGAAIVAASPEYALEKAEEAAERAGEAAQRAADSYNNLADSFERLNTQETSLNNLTRGTKEWNSAVREINNSVLDLIEQYPELAKYVENKDGHLTIDESKQEVQDILAEKEVSMVASSNAARQADIDVLQAKANVQKHSVAQEVVDRDAATWWANFGAGFGAGAGAGAASGALIGAGVGGALGAAAGSVVPIAGTAAGAGAGASAGAGIGAIIGAISGGITAGIVGAETAVANEKAKEENLDAVAMAVAEGKIRYEDGELINETNINLEPFKEELEDQIPILREYGETLKAVEEQQDAYYQAMASNALSLVSMPTDIAAQTAIYNVANGDLYEHFYEDALQEEREAFEETPDKEKKQVREEYAKEVYGEDAKVDGNKVTYTDENGEHTVEVSDEAVIEYNASKKADSNFTEAAENIPAIIDRVSGIEGLSSARGILSSDESGSEMRWDEIKDLNSQNLSEYSQTMFDAMTREEKIIYGVTTAEELEEKIKKMQENANKTFDKLDSTLANAGTGDLKSLGNITATTARILTDKVQAIEDMGADTEAVMASIDNYIADQVANAGWEQKDIDEFVSKFANMKLSEDAIANLEAGGEATSFEIWKQLYAKDEAAKLKAASELMGYSDLEKYAYKTTLAVNERTKAEEKYNDILEDSTATVQELTEAYEAYKNALKKENENYVTEIASAGNSNRQISAQINSLGTSAGIADISSINEETGELIFNDSFFQFVTDSDIKDSIQGLLDQAENNNDKISDNQQAIKNNLKTQKDLLKQQRQSIVDVENMVKERLIEEKQATIDETSAIYEAVATAQNDLVSALQESLNESRQAEENDKAMEALTDKEARLAYLRADTSSNPLEILQLEEELQNEKDSMADTLEDQMLSEMQKSNEVAQEQRNQQIELMQSQLQHYEESGAVWDDVRSKLETFRSEVASGIYTTDTTLFGWLSAGGESLSALATQMSNDELETTLSGYVQSFNTVTNENGQWLTEAENNAIIDEQTQELLELFNEEKAANERSLFDRALQLGSKYGSHEQAYEQNQEYRTAYDSLSGNSKYREMLRSGMTHGGAYLSTQGSTRTGADTSTIHGEFQDGDDDIKVSVGGQTYDLRGYQHHVGAGDETDVTVGELNAVGGWSSVESVPLGTVVKYGGKYYYRGYWSDGQGNTTLPGWRRIESTKGDYNEFSKKYDELLASQQNSALELGTKWANGELYSPSTHAPRSGAVAGDLVQMIKFKTGGLADFTGPAWLDGTPTKPELVLNQRDTQNFIALKDVLAEVMSNNKLGGTSGEQTGDAYIDVDINVDKIDNDYDVEQLARKVREMITNDAMYRNVVVASNFKF